MGGVGLNMPIRDRLIADSSLQRHKSFQNVLFKSLILGVVGHFLGKSTLRGAKKNLGLGHKKFSVNFFSLFYYSHNEDHHLIST